jgi:hypothetical protein
VRRDTAPRSTPQVVPSVGPRECRPRLLGRCALAGGPIHAHALAYQCVSEAHARSLRRRTKRAHALPAAADAQPAPADHVQLRRLGGRDSRERSNHTCRCLGCCLHHRFLRAKPAHLRTAAAALGGVRGLRHRHGPRDRGCRSDGHCAAT